MKLTACLLLLLVGCATDAELIERGKARVLRYGPECGMGADQSRWTQASLEAAAPCIRAKADAETRTSGPGFWESFGKGMQDAGAIMSPDVYNAQRSLPPPAPTQFRNTDLQCMNDCTRVYSYGLCQQRCTY